MPETELSQLLDRSVHHAPPMHLDADAVLAAGRGRVRRRRAVGAGGVLGVVALAGALWFGPGGSGTLTGVQDIQPATTVWERGETVEGTLFTGLQTIDGDQVGHDYTAQLSRPTGDGPVTLTLSDGAAVVEEISSTSPVPGLEVFAGERMTVAVWREPEGVVASVPLVGPVDPSGPANVQHAEVGGEEVAYAVWSADVVPLPEEVVDVYLVSRRGPTESLSGASTRNVGMSVKGHRVQAFADEERGVLGYLAEDREPVLLPVGDRPAQVFSSAHVTSKDVETTVLLLPEGAEVEGFADGERDWGTTWGASSLLGRPLVLVVREDASAGAPPDLAFTLGGRSWTFASYAQDLRELELADGTTVEVLPGDPGDPVVLGRPGTEEPEATFERQGLAESPLVTRTLHGSVVTVVEGWDPGAQVLARARMELARMELGGDGARWVTPGDVAQVVLPDGRLVTVLVTDDRPGQTVSAVGVQDGDAVERWRPSAGEAFGGTVELTTAGGSAVPLVDGHELPEVPGLSLGEARPYTQGGVGPDLLVLPPGLDADDRVVPLLRKGDALDPAPWLLAASEVHQTEAGPVRVVAVQAGMLTEGSLLAVQHAAAVASGAANTWSLMGASQSGHLVLDPGLVVAVGGDAWLLYREGDASSGSGLRAGLVGKALLEQERPDEPSRYDLVAVLPAGSDADLLLGPGADLHSTESYEGPVDGLEVWTASVTVPEASSPADAVRGLDLDGDGEPDLRLPFRG